MITLLGIVRRFLLIGFTPIDSTKFAERAETDVR